MVKTGMLPSQAIREIIVRLRAVGCEDVGFDARELFRMATGRESRLSDQPLTEEEAERLEGLTARREGREPLQYLRGAWWFLDFELSVGEGVLCPRADTEVVAETAVSLLEGISAPKVLDLCAGTGCLGLGVKRFRPDAEVTCLEKSPKAFAYLERNARCSLQDVWEKEGLPQVDRTQYSVLPIQGDLFEYWRTAEEEGLDLIVSNPPYLTAEEMGELQPETAREPSLALDGGVDGLDFYRVLAEQYQRLLRPDGVLVLEIGWQQREAVEGLLRQNDWQTIETRKDYGGNDRCVIARRKKVEEDNNQLL